MAVHFTEEQLDNLAKNAVRTRTGQNLRMAALNEVVFNQLIEQAREATRIKHLELGVKLVCNNTIDVG